MRKLLNIINKILIVASLLGALFFGYKIIEKQKEYRASEESFNKLNQIYNNQDKEVDTKFKELKEINSDFKGWLSVDGTNIDYPVTQTTDNKYYLKHDFYKAANPAGTVFLDYENTSFEDENTIIYAHYMRNKTLFHNLQFFKEKEFFDKNRKIYIETEDYKYEYEIFSIHIPESKFNYITTNFESDDEHEAFIEEIQRRSKFKTDINVTKEDKILTLSTCSYEFKNARTVVHSVLTGKVKK